MTEKLQKQIEDLKSELEDHKKEIAKKLGLLSFQYSTVSGLEYLIEIKNGNSVPSTWTKVNATQKLGRYRSVCCL